MGSFQAMQSGSGIQALMWSAPYAGPEAGNGHGLTTAEVNQRVQRWLRLCALDAPDSDLALLVAAASDARSSSKLLKMLGQPASTLRDWWHVQDHTGYRMTEATGDTDWAYLVLARMSFEARFSVVGALTG
jgi:hypothetical protein